MEDRVSPRALGLGDEDMEDRVSPRRAEPEAYLGTRSERIPSKRTIQSAITSMGLPVQENTGDIFVDRTSGIQVTLPLKQSNRVVSLGFMTS
jgi:hypothetical protein